MNRHDFKVGKDFWCGDRRWRCTDIGSRVIVAICLEPQAIVTSLPGKNPGDCRREVRKISSEPGLFNGPPYAVAELIFDEYDMQGCSDAETA
jgi:hypothetical protein